MLRRPAPPAPRRRPVQADVRAGVKAVAGRIAPEVLLVVVLLAGGAPEASAPTANGALRGLVGQILYVLHPTTVRTRGGGNLGVDLPRGQTVVLVDLAADRAILRLGPSDAGLLRSYGVRKMPRYTATPAQLAADFVPRPVWEEARDEGVRRLRERWPDLTPDRAGKIFLGEPFVGMTEEQAEEAVGRLVLARGPVPGEKGAVAWTVGRRPRAAELRLYNEARERGDHARTFDDLLSTRVRAVLTLRDGIVAAIEPPEGQSPGLTWP